MNLYSALVKDNNSPDKDGKIKIYIEALHHGISDSLLPWALPAKEGTGGSNTYGVSCIPENNSYVWIYFEDERWHRNAFYTWDLNLNKVNPHSLFNDNVKSSVGASTAYPDVKYIYLKNGICIALSSNSSTPEITIYHPSASLFIDKSGNVDIKNGTGDEIIMNATGIEIKAPGKKIKVAGTPGAPNGLGGFCGLAGGACLFTGAIITTDTITGA
jgi:hypothetical protein